MYLYHAALTHFRERERERERVREREREQHISNDEHG